MYVIVVSLLLFVVALVSVAAAFMTRDFWFFMILSVLAMLGAIGSVMYVLLMEGKLL